MADNPAIAEVNEAPNIAVNTIDLSSLKNNLFSSNIDVGNSALDEISSYFEKINSPLNEDQLSFLIDLLNTLCERKEKAVYTLDNFPEIVSALIKGAPNFDFTEIKDLDLIERFAEAYGKFDMEFYDSQKYITLLDVNLASSISKNLFFANIVIRYLIDNREKFEGLLLGKLLYKVLYTLAGDPLLIDSEPEIADTIMYLYFRNSPRNFKLFKFLSVLFQTRKSFFNKLLETVDKNLFPKAQIENFVEMTREKVKDEPEILQTVKDISESMLLESKVEEVASENEVAKEPETETIEKFDEELEIKILGEVNNLSANSTNREIQVIVSDLQDSEEQSPKVWSDNFNNQVGQKLLSLINDPASFYTFERLLSLSLRSLKQDPLELILNFLNTQSIESLANVVLLIVDRTPDNEGKRTANLQNLVKAILLINPEVKSEVNAKLLDKDVEKSNTIGSDLEAVNQKFAKLNDRKGAVEQEVESRESTSNFMKVANKIPVSRFRNFFNNKWREKETEKAKVSVEDQIPLEVDDAINMLNAYFLGDPEGKSFKDLERFALVPSNLELIRNIFITLKNLYESNNPKGFQRKSSNDS